YDRASMQTFADDRVWGDDMPPDTSGYRFKQQMEAQNAPLLVPTGWFDAGQAMSALNRFVALSNPQHVILGPWRHGEYKDADTLSLSAGKGTRDVEPDIVQFFTGALMDGDKGAGLHSIDYYTLGEGTWRTTDTWPPAGTTDKVLYLAQGAKLEEASPAQSS